MKYSIALVKVAVCAILSTLPARAFRWQHTLAAVEDEAAGRDKPDGHGVGGAQDRPTLSVRAVAARLGALLSAGKGGAAREGPSTKEHGVSPTSLLEKGAPSAGGPGHHAAEGDASALVEETRVVVDLTVQHQVEQKQQHAAMEDAQLVIERTALLSERKHKYAIEVERTLNRTENVKAVASEHGICYVAFDYRVVGCQGSCSCGWYEHCYPSLVGEKPGQTLNVGVCGLAVEFHFVLSVLLFICLLITVVAIRTALRWTEEDELGEGKPQRPQARSTVLRRDSDGQLVIYEVDRSSSGRWRFDSSSGLGELFFERRESLLEEAPPSTPISRYSSTITSVM